MLLVSNLTLKNDKPCYMVSHLLSESYPINTNRIKDYDFMLTILQRHETQKHQIISIFHFRFYVEFFSLQKSMFFLIE